MTFEDALKEKMEAVAKMIPIFKKWRDKYGPMHAVCLMYKWEQWFDRKPAGRVLLQFYARQYDMIMRRD